MSVQVDAAIDLCEKHLSSTNSHGTEIEAILTAYVSARIYADFEKEIRRIAYERLLKASGDVLANTFAKIAVKKLIRSIRISEISGVAGQFHDSCKEKLKKDLGDEVKAAWDNIILNRHGVAHEDDEEAGEAAQSNISNLTLAELKMSYEKAKTVLRVFEEAIAAAAPLSPPAGATPPPATT